MRVVHRLPAPALRAVIDRYWSWEGTDALRLLPLMPSPGGLELFFHYYGTPFALDELGAQALPRAHFACVRTRPVELFQRGPTGFVAVRIRTGVGARLTGAAVAEFSDTFMDAEDVWSDAHRLLEQLADAESMDARVDALDRFFIARLRTDRDGAALGPALDRLLRGQAGVAEAARDVGLGTRQLEKRFHAATGLAPARFRRLARLRRSIRALLLAPGEATLTSLLDPAYHDQAQQVREFRELTGLTPSGLRRAAAAGSHFYNPSWPR